MTRSNKMKNNVKGITRRRTHNKNDLQKSNKTIKDIKDIRRRRCNKMTMTQKR